MRGDHLRKVNGEVVSVRRTTSGFWYVIREGKLLGQAGCLRRFSTAGEACDAVNRIAAGGDGWEWIECPD
jgi:hypothetical protein